MKNPLLFLSIFVLTVTIACGTAKKKTKVATKPKVESTTPVISTTSTSNTLKTERHKANNGKMMLIDFVVSDKLTPVLEKAKAEKKLVFVDFSAKWCMPCRIMEDNVFTNADATKDLGAKFLSYQVDIDKSTGADIAAVYEVEALPTLLFLDHTGKVVLKHVGAIGQSEFKALVADAYKKGKP
jgi:thiol:disulfide interchange protein